MISIRRHRSRLLPTAGLFLFVTLSASSLCAEEGHIKGKPVLPGEGCQTSPQASWTSQEKWVWTQVCEGKIADFNRAKGYGGKLDPKKDKEWPKSRIIRPEFLKTILLHEPYRGALTGHGVRILGAWFKKPLDLSDATLSHQLWLDASRFESDIDLTSVQALRLLSLEGSVFNSKASFLMAEIKGLLILSGSKFIGKLDMHDMQVGKSLVMSYKAEFKEVDLVGSTIGDQVDMSGSKFTGKLDMNGMQVGESLLMRDKAEFKEVDLVSSTIGGQLAMDGSKFTGKLNMDSMEVEGSLLMRKVPEFTEVVLVAAKIGGNLEMDGSKFTGKLDMDSMEVGSNLFMRDGAEFTEPLASTFAKIGKNLDVSGSTLASIYLTGTHVRGKFALGPPAPRWLEGAKLTLRNTDVGALQDSPNAWKDIVELELDDFTYAGLGGFDSGNANDMATREVSWFEEWLLKDKSYSPQPYEQLASVLRKEGHPNKANDVLYAGRDRELSEAPGVLNWLGLFLLKVFIGYGHRMYYAIFWFFGFIALGALVLRVSGQGLAHGMPYGIAYSLDMLLPIIRLRECHYDIDLAGWTRYYFYLHILMGYVLGSFLVAGLSGLTK